MFALGVAWGGIVAWPFAHLARRERAAAQVRPLAWSRAGRSAVLSPRGLRRFGRSPVVASIGRVIGAPGVRRRVRRADAAIVRELPVVVDLLGVALAAGGTPYLAIEHAVDYGPPRAALALRGVLHACALGQSLDGALRDVGAAAAFRPLADALRTTARLGSPAAPALNRLAAEVRADLRRRAEARARTVPVRLCFPLVACVLPAFALLTVAPVVLGGLRG